MDYKLNKEQSTVNITVTATSEEWEKQLESAYERTKGKYEVQGFRKGKAPRKQIEMAYGSNVFFEEALENFCAESYSEILSKETDIQPVAYPRMSLQKQDADGLEVLFSVDVMPEVELGAYTGREVEKVEVELSDEEIEHEVEHEIEHHREYSATQENVTGRAVENGDIANIDFEGFVDGEAFDGGKAEGYDLEIGSKTFIEGFEDQVIGMNIGDKRDINVTFPEEYHSEKLNGKPAVFKVKLNSIAKKVLPELTDEWASDVSEFETLAEFKESLRAEIIARLEKDARIKEEEELVKAIIKDSKMDIPHSMIDNEIESMIQMYNQRLAYQGATLEQYLEFTGSNMDAFREQCHATAHANVEARLVLQAIIAKENIDATDADIDARLAEVSKEYGKSVDELKKDMDAHAMEHIKGEIISDKVFAFLRENNKFIDKKSK